MKGPVITRRTAVAGLIASGAISPHVAFAQASAIGHLDDRTFGQGQPGKNCLEARELEAERQHARYGALVGADGIRQQYRAST